MLYVVRTISLRHLIGSPARSLLALLAIVLEVALIFATQVVHRSVSSCCKPEVAHTLAGVKQALLFASLGSVCVGCFIVYDTLAIALSSRRGEIAILRALGVTRARLLGLFVSEAALLGIVGAAPGVGVGSLLARGLLQKLSSMQAPLQLSTGPEALVSTSADVAWAIAAGLLGAVAAAMVPAFRAAPSEGLRAYLTPCRRLGSSASRALRARLPPGTDARRR